MKSIPELERKAVLQLRPYMGENPIVFDVGSNKGFWADILIENVSEMHLFEPNEMLLTYTKVKYDYLRNVHYNDLAVFSDNQNREFHYLTDEHNGLSSVFQIAEWEDLPMKHKQVHCVTLDEYCKTHKIEQIDFLKIDVEGADCDVILGAKNLLKDHKIRFIQIEDSEHYKYSGHTFKEIIDFVFIFGYELFHFNGAGFVRYDNQQAENFYIMEQNFSEGWNKEFIKNTQGLKIQTALEIGAFEGLTTNYICDNLLKEDGRIICIDPLTDEYLPGHKDNPMFKGQYERFLRNTAGRPVELIRKKSIDAFEQLKDLRFGLIYIDGDHTEDAVFQDAVMYWNLLLDTPRGEGGYMLFDDYGQSAETKAGIDRFLETQQGNYLMLVKDYQVLIRRLW